MKRTILIIMLTMVSSAIAGYDYIVQDGDVFGALSLNQNQSLFMTGGGGDSLTLYEWSTALITGTSPYSEYPSGGIRELRLAGYGHLDFYSGDVLEIGLGSYSTASLYGGKIQEIHSGQTVSMGDPSNPIPQAHIEFFC
jgi:hypothetical protein